MAALHPIMTGAKRDGRVQMVVVREEERGACPLCGKPVK